MLLGLFAPFAPFVTEAMYQQFYRDHEGAVSLHVTRWPVPDERWRGDRPAVEAVDQLAVILDATRVLRSAQRLGSSARLSQLIVQAHSPAAETLLDQIAEPLRVAARADAIIRGPAAPAPPPPTPAAWQASPSGSRCSADGRFHDPILAARLRSYEQELADPGLARRRRLAQWRGADDCARRALLDSRTRGDTGHRAAGRVGPQLGDQLGDLGELRLADMDANGIDFQVISHVAPAAQGLAGAEGVTRAREANDRLAEAVKAHPDRFAGFATLPTAEPRAAADELDRAIGELGLIGALVNSTLGSNGVFLDDARFAPLLERFERLDVPLYLHPAPPSAALHEALYSGLPPAVAGGWPPAPGAGTPRRACTCCG